MSGCKKTGPDEVDVKTVTAPVPESTSAAPKKVRKQGQCRVAKDCKTGEACIQQICKPMVNLTCKTDIDCPDYEKCFDGKCAMCTADTDCKSGFACSENGICLPKQEKLIQCRQHSECGMGEVCLNGDCAAFCSSIDECSYPSGVKGMCSRTDRILFGVCEAAQGCNKNDDCKEGYTCYMKSCERIYCQSDADCGDKKSCDHGICKAADEGEKPAFQSCDEEGYCSGKGHCKRVGHTIQCVECTENAHCDSGKQCLDFKCDVACTTDGDCGEGRFCLSTHRCADLGKSCKKDEDCGENNICHVDICRSKSWQPECAVDADCRALAEDGVCDPTPKFGKKYCTTSCDVDADCPDFMGYSYFCMNGACVGGNNRDYCKSDSDCKDGKLCSPIYGECIDDPSKRSGNNAIMFGKTVSEMMTMSPSGIMASGVEAYMNRGKSMSCWRDSECNDMSCSVGGICGCVDDGQCGKNRKCVPVMGCVCTSDKGCPSGFTCGCPKGYNCHDNNHCLCKSDASCGEGKLCTETGQCVNDTDPAENYAHGMNYETGNKVKKDMAKAVQFYQTAMDNGSVAAMLVLGRLYYEGTGVTKNEKLGKALIDTALAYNDKPGKDDPEIPQDAKPAVDKFLASKHSLRNIDEAITKLCLDGKYDIDLEKYKNSLDNTVEGRFKLAEYFERKSDFVQAREYYERCTRHHEYDSDADLKLALKASQKLVDMALNNQGVSEDTCRSNNRPNTSMLCEQYGFIGKNTNDKTAIKEHVLMCKDFNCSCDDDVVNKAIKLRAVSKSCGEDGDGCPKSDWEENAVKQVTTREGNRMETRIEVVHFDGCEKMK
ncbi:MAG: sel1 repeat family protein [Proteobacteria bacterium]|nr:sel1 repeat family protein [Pseudomonadota bacterium]